MKYSGIFTLVIFLVVSAGSAFAQDVDVSVTATVQAELKLSSTDVAFGTISSGFASVLPANENDDDAENIGTGASAGSLTIDGEDEADVQLTFTTATISDGTNTYTFTPSIYNGATPVLSGDTNVEIAGGSVTLDIGGTLPAISESSGTFSTANASGEALNITVQYVDI